MKGKPSLQLCDHDWTYNCVQGVNHLINKTSDKIHTSQFCTRKSPLKLRNMWKKSSFFNMNSTPPPPKSSRMNLYHVNVETAPAEFQMEMTNLQCGTDLRHIYDIYILTSF